MAERTGLAAMVDEAGAREGDVVSDAEQLSLLGLSVPPHKAAKIAGRPAGRRNLRNQRVADYLLAKYRDPLEGLVQMAGLGVEELAAALGCSKVEAFAEKRQCAIAAIPYLHQRQPIAIDATARGIVHLAIYSGTAPAGDATGGEVGPAMGLTLDLAEIVDVEASDLPLPDQDT